MQPPPIIWAIGGSDSGGGAGIQADSQAIRAHGGHPCTAITTITAQNSRQIAASEAVSLELLRAQLDALYQDLPPCAIKIGLLANGEQARLLARWLHGWRANHPGVKVVLDPVLRSGQGQPLASTDLLPILRSELLPLVDLLTPNLPELAALCGRHQISPDPASWLPLADQLRHSGAGAVLIKGGHSQPWQGLAVDLLVSGDGRFWFGGEWLNARHSHGSGCTLAAAIATRLGRGDALADAVACGRAYLQRGLRLAVGLGQGPGPVAQGEASLHPADQPRCALTLGELSHHAEPAPRCPQHLGLYPVLPDCDWLQRALAAGARTVQLRLKSSNAPLIDHQVASAVALGQRYRARVVINDHWQAAIRHGAWGVHLGQEDLAMADLSAIRRAGLRLGLSTHGRFELLRALALRPSYVAIGHLFPTTTKQMASRPQGLGRLREQLQLLAGRLPAVAIGGIDAARIAEVVACGVAGVALVSAITAASQPELALAQLLAAAGQGEPEPAAMAEVSP
ncbi:MAG: thiamine phosphate synthase [Gammaproteobacteria bacterium]|nr:thiamine phosphate synthase [Gammaproteobacteria bacterium]